MSTPIVTFSLFRYTRFGRCFWAFAQMGLVPMQLTPKRIAGLRFGKIMGSGHGNGFSLRPNLTTYALLCAWDDEAAADAFFANHSIFASMCSRADEQWTAYLYTCAAHGSWGGKSPFEVTHAPDPTSPLGVLTRATIRLSKLRDFWRYVPTVSRSMDGMPGRVLSIGVGELPIVQQATFSLWQQTTQMTDYAYKKQAHAVVVRLTRARNWYSEELFARFIPFRYVGAWAGTDFSVLLADSAKREGAKGQP